MQLYCLFLLWLLVSVKYRTAFPLSRISSQNLMKEFKPDDLPE